jgi:hypothetical protein
MINGCGIDLALKYYCILFEEIELINNKRKEKSMRRLSKYWEKNAEKMRLEELYC